MDLPIFLAYGIACAGIGLWLGLKWHPKPKRPNPYRDTWYSCSSCAMPMTHQRPTKCLECAWGEARRTIK